MGKSASDIIREYTADAPIKIEHLVEAFGIKLNRQANLHPQIAGQVERMEDGTYEISVNEKDHYYRRRFTIAHELGHYLLHKRLIDDGVDDTKAYRSLNIGKFKNTKIGPEQEAEANKAAARLLMPAQLVRRYHKEFGGDVKALAKKFQVSYEAMGYRLQGLGLD
jgi:Zn-dependent peptidase ImmA (M78 family)